MTGPIRQMKDATKFHESLVKELLARTEPVKSVASPLAQWTIWSFLALTIVVFALISIKPSHMETALQPAGIVYLVALAFGSALAAWHAVVSSIPGRKIKTLQFFFLVVFLAAVIILPFLFFVPKGEELFEMDDILKCGPDCFKSIALVGITPWLLLGWNLSRNASFSAKWTGAWSGVSTFLLGSLVTLLHCGYWEAGHMVAVHLLTVAFFSLFTTWLGAFWFSRWRR